MRMKHRFSASTAALVVALVGALPAPAQVAGPKKWTVPRTADGQPDLQGIWSNATITPFERPKELAGKEFFTEQEAADYEKRIVKESNRDRRGGDADADLKGAYNELWFDRGRKGGTDQANIAGCRSTRWESSTLDPGGAEGGGGP